MSPLAAECTNVEAAAIQRDFDRRIIDFRIVGNDNDGRVRIGADLFERFVGPHREDLGSGKAVVCGKGIPRIHYRYVHSDGYRHGRKCLGDVDRTDDYQTCRRSMDVEEIGVGIDCVGDGHSPCHCGDRRSPDFIAEIVFRRGER